MKLFIELSANHRIPATDSEILRSTDHISFTRLLILLCSQRFHQRLTKSIVCDMSHAQAWKISKQMPATDCLFSLLKIV